MVEARQWLRGIGAGKVDAQASRGGAAVVDSGGAKVGSGGVEESIG